MVINNELCNIVSIDEDDDEKYILALYVPAYKRFGDVCVELHREQLFDWKQALIETVRETKTAWALPQHIKTIDEMNRWWIDQIANAFYRTHHEQDFRWMDKRGFLAPED